MYKRQEPPLGDGVSTVRCLGVDLKSRSCHFQNLVFDRNDGVFVAFTARPSIFLPHEITLPKSKRAGRRLAGAADGAGAAAGAAECQRNVEREVIEAVEEDDISRVADAPACVAGAATGGVRGAAAPGRQLAEQPKPDRGEVLSLIHI